MFPCLGRDILHNGDQTLPLLTRCIRIRKGRDITHERIGADLHRQPNGLPSLGSCYGRAPSLILANSLQWQATKLVVAQIEEGSRLSDESCEIVKKVTEAFEGIATSLFQTTEAMKQITVGAKDQEEGITDFANGIAQVDTASNEALAAAQQTQKSIAAIDVLRGRKVT